MKSDSIKNITPAIIAVMNEVKGIEKSMTVGTGAGSYKGVADQEVKKIIGDSMAKNGLCLLPTSINSNTKIERWEESTQYGVKQKQSVFTEVSTSYLLTHISGEFIELSGYGHGIDSQDKGAGKATTYALKYTLLYTFLIPTGKIDDADNVHSGEIEMPVSKKEVVTEGEKSILRNLLNHSDLTEDERGKALLLINNCNTKDACEKISKKLISRKK